MFVRESVRIGKVDITLETGRLAKQAHGAVLITMGETAVLVTAVSSNEERPGIDFFPLTCDYIEKTYAGGKIPGGFFKREGRPRDYEVLTARLMDRPLRPLFPEGYKNETQIIATLLSFDREHSPEVLSLTGASSALHISDIPWDGPIAGIRVGYIDGEFVAFPTYAELQTSELDITVACSRDAIVMVEGACKDVTEQLLIDALMFAHEAAQPLLKLIERLRESVGKPKRAFDAPKVPEAMVKRLYDLSIDGVRESLDIGDKIKRYEAYKAARKKAFAVMKEEFGAEEMAKWDVLLKGAFEDDIKGHEMRTRIVDTGLRIGGRDLKTVRPITCEVGVLPRTHGSSLFQRGETQAMVMTTLGTSADEQKIDALLGEYYKSFMLHYNFPPYCTGEVKRVGSVGRRELGHGNLAERALQGMIPEAEDFPYTIRIVSEVLESNGSSSMATVCGGTLSLMDAGVPIKAPVAGIAMGLIKEGGKIAILSDILGDEDHMGDMDFKVCGTARGITAIQMDIKIKGLSREILATALEQAREGRLHILGKMLEALPSHREQMSKWAPRITSLKVKPDQIRLVIGPGGKTIKGIVDQTGVQIDVEDDGTVNVASPDGQAVQRALNIIKGLIAEPEVGVIYKGTVKRITDFGAFVEILPNTDGLLHISEIAHTRTDRVEDVLREGDSIEVKVLSVERDGKIRLSRKALLPEPEGMASDDDSRARRPALGSRRERSADRDRSGPPRERSGRDGDRDRRPPPREQREEPERDRRPRDVDDDVRPPRVSRDDVARERRPSREALAEDETARRPVREARLEEDTDRRATRDRVASEETARWPAREPRVEEKESDRRPRRDARVEDDSDRRPVRESRLDDDVDRRPRRDARVQEESTRRPQREARIEEETERRPRREPRVDEQVARRPRDARAEEETDLRPRRETRSEDDLDRRPRREPRVEEDVERRPRRDARLDEDETERRPRRESRAIDEDDVDTRVRRPREEDELDRRVRRPRDEEQETARRPRVEARDDDELERRPRRDDSERVARPRDDAETTRRARREPRDEEQETTRRPREVRQDDDAVRRPLPREGRAARDERPLLDAAGSRTVAGAARLPKDDNNGERKPKVEGDRARRTSRSTEAERRPRTRVAETVDADDDRPRRRR